MDSINFKSVLFFNNNAGISIYPEFAERRREKPEYFPGNMYLYTCLNMGNVQCATIGVARKFIFRNAGMDSRTEFLDKYRETLLSLRVIYDRKISYLWVRRAHLKAVDALMANMELFRY